MNDIKKYSKIGIDKIRDVNILNEQDMEVITNLTNELQRVFEVKQVWRTEVEMRYSVLNDVSFPDPASKYWQSIREENVFFEQLVTLSFEYQKAHGKLTLKEIEYEKIKGNTKKSKALRQIAEAEIKEIEFGLVQMRLHAFHRVREIKLWEKLKNEQIKKDPTFDISDPNAGQIKSYAKRWEAEQNIGQLINEQNLFRHSKANLDTMKKEGVVSVLAKRNTNG